MDVEIGDNTSDTALFTDVSPNSGGHMVLQVAVSPAGTGRFGYLGSIVLTKTSE